MHIALGLPPATLTCSQQQQSQRAEPHAAAATHPQAQSSAMNIIVPLVAEMIHWILQPMFCANATCACHVPLARQRALQPVN